MFSLSTKPDMTPRRYEHKGNWMEIKPGADGLATIFDRDILVFCISQLIAGMNAGREPSRVVRFQGVELLTATNRMTTGRGYTLLRGALERLAGTRISTNILTGDKEITRGFGLIDSYEIVRETRDGRMQEIEVELSDWVYQAVRAKEVLTLSRDYFRLRKPIERRLYELARKHCGRKAEWRIGLELLRKKCGSTSKLWEFKRLIRKVIDDDKRDGHLPDYSIDLEERDDRDGIIVFRSRGTVPTASSARHDELPPLRPDTYHEARLRAPGWDVRELEKTWRDWVAMSDLPCPKRVDAAFVGFCRKWFERKGRPS